MVVVSESDVDATQPNASLVLLEAVKMCDDFDFRAQNETLYDFIDPETLDSLFTHIDTGTASF